ncbi:AI-2E family transporter [Paralimibaculum aggregatum]|uniref:AI-2E family transporter n=1 Tax=Paralimibaculum aggregatum TaxID=3036245 RepID=A0ABQ6LIN0_9RHOB|nr:AI-2E family transporter [Limibaculum sp. NKW23]GMG82286.1 AI-2E family transporter [Limibaculum sp. NKW23]
MSDMIRAAQRPFFALAFIALAITCLTFSRDYAVPVAVAVLIWFLINALAGAIRGLPGVRGRLPLGAAQTISLCLLFGALALSGRVVAANLAELGAGVSGDEEVAFAKLEALLARIGIAVDIKAEEVFELVGFDRLIGWTVETVRTLLSDASLVFLYVMFLLIDQRFFDAKLRALLPDRERREHLIETLDHIANETRLYIWLMSMISLGVALATYAACTAVGLKGAGFWAFAAFVLNFIPTIGSITAVVLPCLYGLLSLPDPAAIAVLVTLLAATQFVAGEVVLPRLMGDRLNLSSVVILLTLVIWGAMWGPAGMFLAIPITVILALVCARFPVTRPIAVLLSRDGQVPDV